MGVNYEDKEEMKTEEMIVFIQDWVQGYIDQLEQTDSGVLEPQERYAILFSIQLLHMMKQEAIIIQYAKEILTNMNIRVDH